MNLPAVILWDKEVRDNLERLSALPEFSALRSVLEKAEEALVQEIKEKPLESFEMAVALRTLDWIRGIVT